MTVTGVRLFQATGRSISTSFCWWWLGGRTTTGKQSWRRHSVFSTWTATGISWLRWVIGWIIRTPLLLYPCAVQQMYCCSQWFFYRGVLRRLCTKADFCQVVNTISGGGKVAKGYIIHSWWHFARGSFRTQYSKNSRGSIKCFESWRLKARVSFLKVCLRIAIKTTLNTNSMLWDYRYFQHCIRLMPFDAQRALLFVKCDLIDTEQCSFRLFAVVSVCMIANCLFIKHKTGRWLRRRAYRSPRSGRQHECVPGCHQVSCGHWLW